MTESMSQNGAVESGTAELAALLRDLHATCSDIELSMVVTQDGLTMATHGGLSGADGDRVGALSAGLLALCRNTARELERGEMEEVLLRGREGYLLLRLAGPIAILAVVARPDANLGMVLLDTARAADEVAGLL